MPAYAYDCKECELTTIVNRPIDDRDLQMICAACKCDMIRTIQTPSITFKGAGFYTTDKRTK